VSVVVLDFWVFFFFFNLFMVGGGGIFVISGRRGYCNFNGRLRNILKIYYNSNSRLEDIVKIETIRRYWVTK
jgi:hypothetical protein